MALPLLKMGTLALKTLSKPIVARLTLRNLIFSIVQVAVTSLVIEAFEVQKNSRAEAYKQLHMQEMEKLRQRDIALSKEMEGLKNKILELEQLSRGKGLTGMFNFRFLHTEEGKSATLT
ncbi:hypothetical protein FXO37_03306 [Capsicum annuum]|nr:hypothetical protein FXO37_03306 [Capsicum annuum]